MQIPKEKIKWSQLPSGLRVVTAEMPNFYTISAGIFGFIGSRFETKSEIGISHFIEHLLFKGSQKYSAKEMSELIEGRGGTFNGYTSEESTCFYFKTLPDSFLDSMEVLVDLYTAPIFDPQEIEKEKEVIIEELHSYEDQPSLFIDDFFSSVIWGDHPLGHLILGHEKQLLNYGADELKNYFTRHYTSANTVIAVAGCTTHAEVVDWVSKQQSRFLRGDLNSFLPYKHKQKVPIIRILNKESEQCNLQLGVPCGNRYSKDQWALRLLNTLMGENMSSRLFQEIREKRGVAYHITSGLELYEDVGYFYIQSGVDLDKVEVCLKESMRVVKEFCEDLVSEEELKRAKSYITGQALQEMESTLSCMLWIGDIFLGKERKFLTSYFCKKIEQVTREEIRAVAKKIFRTNHLNLALIGPYDRIEFLTKLLSSL